MSVYDDFISDPARLKVYLQEAAVVSFSELVSELMLKHSVGIPELAEKMGIGQPTLFNYLDKGNIDPRTMAKMLYHLGYSIEFSAKRIKPLGVPPV